MERGGRLRRGNGEMVGVCGGEEKKEGWRGESYRLCVWMRENESEIER